MAARAAAARNKELPLYFGRPMHCMQLGALSADVKFATQAAAVAQHESKVAKAEVDGWRVRAAAAETKATLLESQLRERKLERFDSELQLEQSQLQVQGLQQVMLKSNEVESQKAEVVANLREARQEMAELTLREHEANKGLLDSQEWLADLQRKNVAATEEVPARFSSLRTRCPQHVLAARRVVSIGTNRVAAGRDAAEAALHCDVCPAGGRGSARVCTAGCRPAARGGPLGHAF